MVQERVVGLQEAANVLACDLQRHVQVARDLLQNRRQVGVSNFAPEFAGLADSLKELSHVAVQI